MAEKAGHLRCGEGADAKWAGRGSSTWPGSRDRRDLKWTNDGLQDCSRMIYMYSNVFNMGSVVGYSVGRTAGQRNQQ